MSPSLPPDVDDCQPLAVEVVRFHKEGDTLAVEMFNPNAHHGLVRARLSVAALDRSGGIIGVFGTDGVEGAQCCTIYDLPPGASFFFVTYGLPKRAKVAAVELETIGDWFVWQDLDHAPATVTDVRGGRGRFGYGKLTGRVAVDGEGPYNVIVQAVMEGSRGRFGVISDVVDCVQGGGRPRAFEITGPGELPGRVKLGEVVAYTTTVTGAEGTAQEPPGC